MLLRERNATLVQLPGAAEFASLGATSGLCPFARATDSRAAASRVPQELPLERPGWLEAGGQTGSVMVIEVLRMVALGDLGDLFQSS